MPDITYPNTLTAGTTTDADKVAENLFYAEGPADASLEVINRLTKTNLATALITREMVRPGAFFEGATTGHTANRDFFKQMYPANWDADYVDDAAAVAAPVAGLCKSERFDNTNSLCCVSWGFGVIIDDGNLIGTGTNDKAYGFKTTGGGTAGNKTSVHLFVNGVQITRCNWYLRQSDTTMAQFDKGFNRPDPEDIAPIAYHQDSRWEFGAFIIDAENVTTWFTGDTASLSPLLPGIHTAELRVASKKRMVRFKSSNISIFGMR